MNEIEKKKVNIIYGTSVDRTNPMTYYSSVHNTSHTKYNLLYMLYDILCLPTNKTNLLYCDTDGIININKNN